MHKLKRKSAAIFLAALTLTGCANMGAPYDAQTEKALMSLNGKTSEILIDLEGSQDFPEINYKQYQNAYKAVHLELSNLELRASAIPKNDKTQKQIVLLTKTVKQFEALHQLDFGKTLYGKQEAIKTSRLTFKQALKAMLKLELAKKRGIDTSATTTTEGS